MRRPRVLVIPLIGNLNEQRAGQMLFRLLQEVVDRTSRAVILDLTGVEQIDTTTANHLFQIIRSVELLGSTAIVSGIQPNVAKTMVELSIHIEARRTYPTLAEALRRLIDSHTPYARPRQR